MKTTMTVLFDDLEIEAEVKRVYGVKGDRHTADTKDCYELTGKYGYNGIDISNEIKALSDKMGGIIEQGFNEQINQHDYTF